MSGDGIAAHATRLADKLRRAADEGQSPWTDEGTCLIFTDAAKTLVALADRVEAAEKRLQICGVERETAWSYEDELAARAVEAEARVSELEAAARGFLAEMDELYPLPAMVDDDEAAQRDILRAALSSPPPTETPQ